MYCFPVPVLKSPTLYNQRIIHVRFKKEVKHKAGVRITQTHDLAEAKIIKDKRVLPLFC
jgi:hypothetical protein